MAGTVLSQYAVEYLFDRPLDAIVTQFVIEAIHPTSALLVLAQYVIEYIPEGIVPPPPVGTPGCPIGNPDPVTGLDGCISADNF